MRRESIESIQSVKSKVERGCMLALLTFNFQLLTRLTRQAGGVA